MGLTVNQTLERAREEVFEAGGVARPAWDLLKNAVTDTTSLTVTLEGRQTYVPPDGDIEYDDNSMEIADVQSTSGAVVTLFNRGALGSDAATHTAGTRVFLDSPYKKYLLLNGLKAIIGQLAGYGLYAVKYTDTLDYSTTAPVPLIAGTTDVLEVLYENGTQWMPIAKNQWRIFHHYTALNVPAIQFLGAPARHGANLRVTYTTDFNLTTFTLTTDLDTVGVPSTLQPHLAQGLSGHVLSGRDVPLLESEHIRPDPQAPQQPGTRLNVGRALWTSFLSGPVKAELVRQMKQSPPQLVYERI